MALYIIIIIRKSTICKEEVDWFKQGKKIKRTHVVPDRGRKQAAASISNGLPGPSSDSHRPGCTPLLWHAVGPFGASSLNDFL